jgi:putative membrane protein
MNPNDAALQNAQNALGTAQFYLQGLPAFGTYFGLALLFSAVFAVLYWRITPHDEVRLVRAGNTAAIPAFLGALIGFVLPLRTAMVGSYNMVDFAVWALIAAVVQIAAYFIARLVMPDVSRRITEGEPAAGLWLGGISIFIGIINSSAMTY